MEWFRPQVGRRLLRIWWAPALMILGAATCLCYAGVVAEDPTVVVTLTAIGLPLTVLGAYWGLRGFFKFLSENTCLELHTTGLRYRWGDEDRFVLWDAIDAIDALEEGVGIVITLESEPPWHIRQSDLGMDATSLAQHLMKSRNKALMGLLRPNSPA